nr:hypothetical protein CTI12_AA461120 [Tanacetum cinerariifolium]
MNMSNTIFEDLFARCLVIKEIIDASIARIDSIRNDKAEEETSAKEAKESSYEGADNIIGKENGSKNEKNKQPKVGPTRVEPKPQRHNRMNALRLLYASSSINKPSVSIDLFCIAIGYEDETMKTVFDMYWFKLNMAIMRTLFVSSMHHLVQTSQVSALVMLECRLEGDHHANFKQQEDERDNGILVRSVTDHAFQTIDLVDESHPLSIPFHILEMIMGHCVGVEYMKFRATCKHCNLVAPPIQWSNKRVLNILQTYSLVSPWLMVLDKDQGIITFTDPVLGDNYFIKTPQKLIGSQIYCSRLMYKINEALVFFNPFTNDMCELPYVNFLDSYCFSAPPTSLDYKPLTIKEFMYLKTWVKKITFGSLLQMKLQEVVAQLGLNAF